MRNVKNISEQLSEDEGKRRFAYKDHLGYLTIGKGRLIDSRKGGGLSEDEIEYLFQNDLKSKTAELRVLFPWFDQLDEVRQGVLINMAFQMGAKGLAKFTMFIRHVAARRYTAAAVEMLDSLWASQTPERAERLARQMTTGVWQ